MARIQVCIRNSHMYTYGYEARHAERADEAEALQWVELALARTG